MNSNPAESRALDQAIAQLKTEARFYLILSFIFGVLDLGIATTGEMMSQRHPLTPTWVHSMLFSIFFIFFGSFFWCLANSFRLYRIIFRCEKNAPLLIPRLYIKSSDQHTLNLMDKLDKPILLVLENLEPTLEEGANQVPLADLMAKTVPFRYLVQSHIDSSAALIMTRPVQAEAGEAPNTEGV